MAFVFLGIPCSEMSVERAFSDLKHVLGTRRQSMEHDLLEHGFLVCFSNLSSLA
jgi:hypothetical protein